MQDDVGAHRSLVRRSGPTGARRTTTYGDDTSASLVTSDGRLAWRVQYRAGDDAVYDATVDARTGKVLRRVNMVKRDTPASVWERFPGNGPGGTPATVNLEQNGWLTSTAANLNGPNAHAYSDLDDNNVASASEEVARAGGGFNFALQSVAGHGLRRRAPVRVELEPPTGRSTASRTPSRPSTSPTASTTTWPALGFTAAMGAFEGADDLLLETMDGASTGPDGDHLNNANMFTPPNGSHPRMQMYLWSSPFRRISSGSDAAVLYHEYTHGLSNRLVTDADGYGALNSAQAGAMGEGWSDFYAQDFIVGQYPELDTGAAGEVKMGAYTDLTGSSSKLRYSPLDCPPVGADPIACPGRITVGSGGFTYGDFGRIAGGAEVHADGEIWAQTLWDLRTAVGPAKARALVTTGMSLLAARAVLPGRAQRDLPRRPDALRRRRHGHAVDRVRRPRDGLLRRGRDRRRHRAGGELRAAAGGRRGARDDHRPRDQRARRRGRGGRDRRPGGRAEHRERGDRRRRPLHDRRRPGGQLPEGQRGRRRVGRARDVAVGRRRRDAHLRRRGQARLGGGQGRRDDHASNGREYAEYGCGPNVAIDQSQVLGWSTMAGSDKNLVVQLPAAITVTQFGHRPDRDLRRRLRRGHGSIPRRDVAERHDVDRGGDRHVHQRQPPHAEPADADGGRERRPLRPADAALLAGRGRAVPRPLGVRGLRHAGRHDRAGHHDRVRPVAVRVHLRRPDRDVRVQGRRRRVRGLHVAGRAHVHRRRRTRSSCGRRTRRATSTRRPPRRPSRSSTIAAGDDAGERRSCRSCSRPREPGDVRVQARRGRVRGVHVAVHAAARWRTASTRSRCARSAIADAGHARFHRRRDARRRRRWRPVRSAVRVHRRPSRGRSSARSTAGRSAPARRRSRRPRACTRSRCARGMRRATSIRRRRRAPTTRRRWRRARARRAAVHVLGDPRLVDVRVQGRRRRLRGVHVAVHARPAGRRRAHVRGPRGRRPDAGDPDLHGRHDAAGHHDRQRARRRSGSPPTTPARPSSASSTPATTRPARRR